MALLAEEVVEEWLNRQGFFTIRGIRLGVAGRTFDFFKDLALFNSKMNDKL